MSDRYEIRDKIGQGGVGAVYKAFDTQLKREVALKRLLTPDESEANASPEDAEKFTDDLLKEATTLSSLQHPNIVTIYDVGKDDKGPFVVMELLRGETFDETIGRGALPEEDFKKVVTQTLEALIAAHDSGLVHRDLKPGNLMVIWLPSGKFQIKILDFGLAKFGKLPSKQTADQEDGILGSIYFMAPEQFERIGLDARTDMYALGSIFYYALTGKYPFEGDNAPQVMAAHLQHRVAPLDKLRPDIPQWLASWVMWLISREMKDRPLDAKQAFDFYNREESGLKSTAPATTSKTPTVVAAPKPARAPTRLLNTGGGNPPGAKTKALAGGSQTAIPVGQVTTQVAGSAAAQAASGQLTGAPQEVIPQQPGFMPPAKKPFPFPKWAMITVPLLAIAIFGIYKVKTGNRDARTAYHEQLQILSDTEEPGGDAETVQMLIEVLEGKNENHAIAAIQILEKLQGDGVEKAIVASLQKVRTVFGKEGIISVITRRKIKGAIPDIAKHLSDKFPQKVREAAVYAIGTIGTEADLIDLLRELKAVNDEDTRSILEMAVVNLSKLNPEGNKRSTRIRGELMDAKGAYRMSMLHVLAQLGGDRAWKELSSALEGDDVEETKTILKGLQQWPDFQPGEKLAGLIESTEDPAVRMLAIRAYSSLLANPSSTSAGEKVATIQKVMDATKSRREKQSLLAVVAQLIDPTALELMRSYSDDPQLGQSAKFVADALEKDLKKVIAVPADETTLPTSGAIIHADEAADIEYVKEENAITGWNRDYYAVLWPVKIEQPGKYAVTALTGSNNKQEQSFTVSLAGNTIESDVVNTGSLASFKPVKAGEFDVLSAGYFKLSISGKKMADYGDLMSLREVTIKRIGDVTPDTTE